jgi:hypothetical protein
VTGPGGAPDFDPRHDARFQRGYRPGEGGDPTTPAVRSRAARPAAAAPLSSAGAPAPVGQPAAADPAATAQPDGFDGLDDPDGLDELAFDPDAFQDELEPSRWNPFIALLWVLGPLFVVLAAAGQYWAGSLQYSNYSYSGTDPAPWQMLVPQLAYAISPSILTTGLVIIAGLLFWHAAAWRARRRPAPPR